jgi:NAD(P)-dependent dehydrogenase (short-subunit alcohol dehydrogenase family)
MPKPTHAYNRLAGKVAIVTGAGCFDDTDNVGTGAAIAALFAGEGARVCVVDFNRDNGERMARRIQSTGGTASFVKADVTSLADCERVVRETITAFGRVDILVNNVGGNLDAMATKIGDFDETKWRQIVDLNLTSAMLMSKAAIPALTQQSASSIVNMASLVGMLAASAAAYGASKGGLIALTRDLALTYGGQGLRANVIAPGYIFTPMAGGVAMDERYRKLRRNIAPLGIEGDAWDIAAAAVFLASEDARFITGICLPVDGGASQIAPIAAYGLAQR